MRLNQGAFVISLDYEMLWGILDHEKPMEYEENIKNVRRVIPIILRLFEKYDIHATWGIVGLLFEDSLEGCKKNIPNELPTYKKPGLSSYDHFDELGTVDPRYLFAKDIIKIIQTTEGQEIGSHTYSHFYCREDGQTKQQFENDIKKAIEKAKELGVELKTIIFPRNQYNGDYSDVLKEYGVCCYRGNERNWFYHSADKRQASSVIRRGLRLIDSYLPITGFSCYRYSEIRDKDGLFNIPSSRFFRPYSRYLGILEPMRLRRIKLQMRYAAKHGMVFHLWWHPHNFGKYPKQNINNLKKILSYYLCLKKKYGLCSYNMKEVVEMVMYNGRY